METQDVPFLSPPPLPSRATTKHPTLRSQPSPSGKLHYASRMQSQRSVVVDVDETSASCVIMDAPPPSQALESRTSSGPKLPSDNRHLPSQSSSSSKSKELPVAATMDERSLLDDDREVQGRSESPPSASRNRQRCDEEAEEGADEGDRREGSEAAADESHDRAHNAEQNQEDDAVDSYQDQCRFRTWKKHVNQLYRLMVHIDLVWESPSVQILPFMTVKDHMATQLLLCGTRTCGAEQNYLQLFAVTTPVDASALDDDEAGGFSEITGEVGGYGRAPSACGMRVERRMFHDGDVYAARYMHGNPLLLGTASSDGNLYVFDWSRVSLQSRPNRPERPRGPLPPNALSDDATDEERSRFLKRMKAISDADKDQQQWDRQRGESQHVVKLVGLPSASTFLDWNSTEEGLVVSGTAGKVAVWQVATLSKTDPRQVEPCWSVATDEATAVRDAKFSWGSPFTVAVALDSGALAQVDLRCDSRGGLNELCNVGAPISGLSWCPNTTTRVAVSYGTDGSIALLDTRNPTKPTSTCRLHSTEVTCLQWCPHRDGVIATGGDDGIVTLYDTTRQEVLFRHSGHTDPIMDLSWCWQDTYETSLATVDQNAIMLWRPRDLFLTPTDASSS